jgi:hypothetical protein
MPRVRKSRAELNRDLRRILSRHQIDMSLLTFYATPTGVNISGVLKSLSGDELSTGKMQSLVENMKKNFGHIQSDLSNWDISEFSFKKKQKKKYQSTA